MKKALILLIIFILLLFIAGCGSNAHHGSATGDSGAIAFSLSWNTSSPSPKALMAPPPGADVCTYYQITTINAVVTDSSGQNVASGSWSCSDHSGTISTVPVGTVSVTIEGVVGGVVVWRGQATGITVAANQTVTAGTITMSYIGSDTTAPTVQTVSPANGASGVSSNTTVSATFSEDVVSASINANTFILTCGTTTVSGTVTYDSPTRTAIFTPSSSLPASSSCAASITTGVEDLAGHLMATNYPWSFTTQLPVPTGVSAAAGDRQVTISWNTVTGATSYNIYWSTTTGVTTTNGTKIPGVTSPYTKTPLTNGTTYYYIVTAVNSYGESSASTEVSATPRTAPSAPTLGSATPGNAAVTISLTAPTTHTDGTPLTNLAGFKVYFGRSSGSYTNTVDIGNSTSYTVTNLSPGSYYFAVTAYDTTGLESGYSNEASTTVQ